MSEIGMSDENKKGTHQKDDIRSQNFRVRGEKFFL
jgi:hypothetical protein